MLPLLLALAACGSAQQPDTATARDSVRAGEQDSAAASSVVLVPSPPPLGEGFDFPTLTGRVVDGANLLPVADRDRIVTQSAALEKATGHQLVVVTVPDLGGHSIEQYGLNLGRTWRVGRKNYNDGALLIVAPKERKVRIEVGRGLEQQLRDEEAAQILRDDVLPAFKAGDMPKGIQAGVDDIIREVSEPARKAA